MLSLKGHLHKSDGGRGTKACTKLSVTSIGAIGDKLGRQEAAKNLTISLIKI